MRFMIPKESDRRSNGGRRLAVAVEAQHLRRPFPLSMTRGTNTVYIGSVLRREDTQRVMRHRDTDDEAVCEQCRGEASHAR